MRTYRIALSMVVTTSSTVRLLAVHPSVGLQTAGVRTGEMQRMKQAQ